MNIPYPVITVLGDIRFNLSCSLSVPTPSVATHAFYILDDLFKLIFD